MVYRDLLIENGGINIDDQCVGHGECAVLNIGLGGTGISCLRAVKKKLGNSSEEYRRTIKYLAIDADHSDLRRFDDTAEADHSDQCLYIGTNIPLEATGQAGVFPWYRNRDVIEADLNTSYVTPYCGTACYRQTGRALLLLKRPELMHKLRTVLGSILNTSAAVPCVNIFAGSGGGMGSGALIDLCYIVRTVLSEMSATNVKVSAYVIMPDVYFNDADDLRAFRGVAQRINANSYSFFKELEYCMGFGEREGSWDMNCGYYHETFNVAPVDVCYLVCDREMNNTVSNIRYNDTVADHVIGETFNSGNTEAMCARKGFAVIGAADAGVDFKGIYNYLAALTFKDMKETATEQIKSDSIEEIVRELHLDFDSLLKELTCGIDLDFKLPEDLDWKDFRGMSETDGMPFPVDNHFNTILQKKLNDLQYNRYIMDNDAEDEPSPFNRARKKMEELIVDPAKGPEYVAAFVCSDFPDLESLVSVATYNIERVRWVLKEHFAKANMYRRNVDEAWGRYAHAGLLVNRSRAFDDYLNAVADEYKIRFLTSVFETLDILLRGLKNKLCRYYEDKIRPCCECLRSINETFIENYLRFEHDNDHWRGELVNLPDIRDMLENVEYYSCKDDVIKEFYNNLYVFTGGAERSDREIVKFVSEFVDSLYAEYRHNSLYNYMGWKHRTHDPIIIRGIYTYKLEELASLSGAKYSLRSRREQDEEVTVKFLFPENDNIASSAASNYSGRFICSTLGVPLPMQKLMITKTVFGYGIADYSMIETLHNAYLSLSHFSMHSYPELSSLPNFR
ncbi:MAG: hypothetical protein IJ389_04180 [Clostridia bacterium]|nr:hypothetical protein [Clostridia bacterium]